MSQFVITSLGRMKANELLVPTAQIEALILMIRGHKVLLDRDLAVLYGVETKALNQDKSF